MDNLKLTAVPNAASEKLDILVYSSFSKCRFLIQGREAASLNIKAKFKE